MKYRLMVFLLLLVPLLSSGQDYRLQYLFVYNFAKYIEWPAGKQQGDFVIGVLGGAAVVSQFKTNLEGRPKGIQKIIIHDLSASSSYSTCQMIFIVKEQSAQLGTIKQAVSSQHVLIITEKEGSLEEGSSINMFVKNGKMVFEINEQLKKSSFRISTEVLRLANL